MSERHGKAPPWAAALRDEIMRFLDERLERQRNVIRELEFDIMRKLDDLQESVHGGGGAGSGKLVGLGLTTKQHVVLQMLLAGRTNAEIAERMGVQPSTAKVQVRSIARRLGVRTRVEITAALHQDMREVDEDVYEQISGGLPKDWEKNYSEPDEYAPLYRRGA